jgi:uncharacterized protein (DUF1015 family)
MARIAPLTPLRYDLALRPSGLAGVVAPPYDVINAEERAALAARDPHNVVRLILPEGEGETKYANAATLLAAWRNDGVLVRDGQAAFYRYDQTFVPPGGGAASITRRGFLALVELAPFADRIVLPHERTLSGPKEDRLKLFRATRTNLSPGFMLYRDPRGELDAPLDTGDVIAEFATEDGVNHVLAKVSERDAVRAIVEGIARSSLLIADGHHRYETALRYRDEVTAAHPNASARAEHRFFMTFLVNGDDKNLVVFPTHRHVHSLPHFSFDDLLQRAEDTFTIARLADGADADAIRAALEAAGRTSSSVAAAARDGRVAILSLRADVDLAKHPALGQRPAVLRKTDVAVLHSGILEHVLGITPEAQAAKTNLWYPQDTRAALGKLRGGGGAEGERPMGSGDARDTGDVLFVMNATPVADVRDVAEAGEVMPQKSTFFYPKVLTGLAIHTLEPEREVASV